MSEFALGLIETRGKLAAIEAADVALKSANVALCDVENATGALITVKVIGDVGAVKAAIDAAKAKASLFGEVVATRVIPRPAPGTKRMTHMVPSKVSEIGQQYSEKNVPNIQKTLSTEDKDQSLPPLGGQEENNQSLEQSSEQSLEKKEDSIVLEKVTPTCNLCLDPACTRKKGEPSKFCIKSKKKVRK